MMLGKAKIITSTISFILTANLFNFAILPPSIAKHLNNIYRCQKTIINSSSVSSDFKITVVIIFLFDLYVFNCL